MVDNLSLSAEIVKLTRAMLDAADRAQWDRVRSQQQRRQSLLAELRIAEVLDERGRGALAANLQEAAALNDRLTALGVQARAELERAMTVLQRGRRANLAYHGMK